MRLISLRIKNVGPFLDQRIDFTLLGEMFLITGKTGSGKTTIFDAVTYALYGKVPGTRSSGDVSMRSDYAAEDDEALVDLEFAIAGDRYRVVRTVPGTYTTRSGTKKTRQVTVDLSFCGQDGWQEIPGTASQKTQRIQSIVGLTSEEFTQIVLLPQGSFAEFLHQTPARRKETLSKLFPVQFYTRMCETAESMAKTAADDINHVQRNLEQALESTDTEESRARLCQVEAGLLESETSEKKFIEEMRLITQSLTETDAMLDACREALKLTEQKKILDERKVSMDILKERLMRAMEASLIAEKINASRALSEQLARTREEAETVSLKLSAAGKESRELEESRGHFEELMGKRKRNELIMHDMEAEEKKILELDDARRNLEGHKESIRELYGQTAPACMKARETLDEIQAKLTETEGLLLKTEATIQSLTEQKSQAERNHAAFALSRALKEGSPCPVCGSLTHPCPAQAMLPGINVDEEISIQTKAKEGFENQREALRAQKESMSAAEKILSSLTDELEDTAGAFAITLEPRENLPRRQKSVPSENHIDAQKRNIMLAQQALHAAAGRISALEGQCSDDRSGILAKKEMLIKENEDLDNQIESYESRARTNLQELSAFTSASENLKRRLEEQEDEAEKSGEEISRLISESGFGSEEQVLDSFMPRAEHERLSAEHEDFMETYRTVCARLQANDADISGMGALEEKSRALKDRAESVQKDYEDAQQKKAALLKEKHDLSSALERIADLTSQLDNLKKRNAALIRLSQDLNARPNPKKIPFDSWVLGTFLEDVVHAANLRFIKISSGRYMFNLQTEKQGGNGAKGLDLTVTDSFTGQERSTLSLSGGETFMASLSLALALTDLVQAQSGGITLDSLFIDEGFGSLDGQALDNAISILQEIRGQRTVGIISHVESLEHVIESQLHVIKTSSGSTIEIRD